MKPEARRAVRGRDLTNQLPAALETRPEAPPQTATPSPSHEQMLRELKEPKLTVEELARLWRVRTETIYRDIKKGALRAQRTPGGDLRILLSDARAYGQPIE